MGLEYRVLDLGFGVHLKVSGSELRQTCKGLKAPSVSSSKEQGRRDSASSLTSIQKTPS